MLKLVFDKLELQSMTSSDLISMHSEESVKMYELFK